MANHPRPARLRSIWHYPPDGVGLLSVFLLVLVAVPSRLIVGPLGGAGTPAQIIGMALAAYWIVVRTAQAGRPFGRQPIRVAMLVFAAAVTASYIVAATRPIAADELRAADLGMLMVLGWLGIQFTAMDAIPSRGRFDVLLRRLVCGAGALATLGLLQYFTKQPYTNYIQIPGLQTNGSLVSVYGREGLTRPAGTALHPIEFGAVLTMSLPFALHYAFTDTDRGLVRRWFPVIAIALAVPISISRSALVSSVIALCCLIPTWPRQRRRRAYAFVVVLTGAIYVLVPGLLGTLTGLFTGITTDSSAQSRTSSYSLAADFIARQPVFGRGFATFLPSYRILDNQYLGLLIDIGFVGTAALIGLLLTGVASSHRAGRRSYDPHDRGLGSAFVASIASATVSLALFDAFSFPMSAALLFFVLGCAAAFHRLADPDTSDEFRVPPAWQRVG